MLILLGVGLALCAAVLVLWERPVEPGPLPLSEGDQEIVWLYAATSQANWERFVTAVKGAAEQLAPAYPDLEVQVTDRTFPAQTTAVPELALAVRGGAGRLVFRWYKLTSDQKAEWWVEKLVGGKRRPPLAIVGGASSDLAIDLAQSLNETTARHPAAPPLLVLTTATADRTQARESDAPADDLGQGMLLNRVYPGRTCRFCFTNRQMAEAVTSFIWDRDELRPDVAPVYMIVWEDDAYSKDLTGRFSDALRPRMPDKLPVADYIDCSIGSFDQPNRWEAEVVRRLMETKLQQHPEQKRPLLVLPAAAQGPARRFLRGLERASPAEARGFVVATGDGLAFNTVYRDRNVSWPIQDLPFDLIFFCHRNPVDERAGFRPDRGPRTTQFGQGVSSTGTEDLLLYMDIVKALVHAAHEGDGLPRTGDELRQRLSQARWKDGGVSFDPTGVPLFDDDGNRCPGTGEHVVWLQPVTEGKQVLPRARIRVWSWPAGDRLADTTLQVDYDIPRMRTDN